MHKFDAAMNHPKDMSGEREKQLKESYDHLRQQSPYDREAKKKAALFNLSVLFAELLTDIFVKENSSDPTKMRLAKKRKRGSAPTSGGHDGDNNAAGKSNNGLARELLDEMRPKPQEHLDS
mmetsp:Transcript_39860/g.113094  ORF Transcript_39860/g.113094 Transcript_39860/m.113094 type:complete len:121 (-) Transcript_39860:325-687(-)